MNAHVEQEMSHCKKCGVTFIAKHFNQKCCGKPCREALRREARSRYKKTSKGKATEMRWRQNPKKREIDRVYYTSEKGRKNAVRRVSRLLATNPIYRIQKRLRQTAAYRRLREHLIQRDLKCQRCGATTRLTLDHVKSISEGGEHSETNVQLLCISCNVKKKSKVIRYANGAVVG